jgi:hemin uptake protein HemP
MLDSQVQPMSAMSPTPAAEPASARIGAACVGLSRISSGRLLAGARELVIEHAGQEYRLRLTRNDKLILTK